MQTTAAGPPGRRSPAPVRIGFAVSTLDMAHGSGDLYTARGLGQALERLYGWQVRYLPTEQWCDVAGLDVFVAMVDGVDLGPVRRASPGVRSVAWMRNWLERWIEKPWLGDFGVHLCSSGRGVAHIQDLTGIRPHLFPIAAALDLFRPGPVVERYAYDYVFTGNYWLNAPPRDVERFDPGSLPYRFKVFGRKWHKHPQYAAFSGGFVPYETLPIVYNSTPVTIDDAVTHTTKLWGSMNSRVFEALASGSLVLTNNALGSAEIFEGRLPVWNNPDELRALVIRFLDDPAERHALLQPLRTEVLQKHGYEHRARRLHDLLGFADRPGKGLEGSSGLGARLAGLLTRWTGPRTGP